MRPGSETTEVWLELHYRYKGELFRFNLPLHSGEKYLDGLRIDFSHVDIDGGRRLRVELEPLGTILLESLELTGSLPYGDDVKSVFVNGYQSWTGSRERSPGERISALNWPGRLLSFQRFGDDRFCEYSERKGRFHGFTYAYIRYPDGLLFAGSLDERAGYTIISTDVRRGLFAIRKDVAGLQLDRRRLMLDLALLEGTESEVFGLYADMREDGVKPGKRAAYWSTGRDGQGGLDEVGVRGSLAALRTRKVPLDYFIIDDGWQAAMGDWGDSAAGFPSGMASLATEIRGSRYVPGLWFAPFAVGADSLVFRTRKDWLARDSRGRIRPAGWIPRHGGTFYALDTGNPDAVRHISESIARFRDDWGFGFLRMDLLYTAALYPPKGKSRGEAMTDAMAFLESCTGGIITEYSAVPLETAFGRGDYCRIAADTTPYWEHRFQRNIHARERASTQNALRSTVGRRHLDGRFFSNSLDSFRLAGEGNSMEASRRYTQMLLHYLLGTLIGCGDEPERFTDVEMNTYLALFPMARPDIDDVTESRRTVTIRYRVGGRRYIAIANLAERIRPFQLPRGPWFGAPGLERRAHHLAGEGRHVLKPGESRNYMLVESSESGDSFAGSDGHIFPGREVESIAVEGDGWRVRPVPGALREFRVWIRVPQPSPVLINGGVADVTTTPFGMHLASAVVRVDRPDTPESAGAEPAAPFES